MGRLKEPLLERVRVFASRVLDVVDVLEEQRRSKRVLDQLTGSGASVAANTYEADEALSRPDFVKTLGIAMKELSETRFWLELCVLRGWVKAELLADLLGETKELRAILGTIIAKSRRSPGI